MARTIDDRLENLRVRRSGTDAESFRRVNEAAQIDLLMKSATQEAWQKRARSQPYTRYALGAMQAVGVDYTRIGIETAERIGKQLVSGLSVGVEFRLQGSVPLDVHIRGVSDVDLLALLADFHTYATNGVRSRAGLYRSPATVTSLDALRGLRAEAESVLKAAYPAATVDCTGGKCIELSGGSLARPVDVVPSHWLDTVEYQSSYLEHDRGVTILNKKVPETIDNLPFLHISRVHERDAYLLGGLKKAIRLTKNVKNDAENVASAMQLPSFDIAALMYHANQDALRSGSIYELAILRETQRFLDWCYRNPEAARQLRTPDGSRIILDSEAKAAGLLTISNEMDALAMEVAKEQVSALRTVNPLWSQIDEALRNSYVPPAA
ncbi:hypothetical protein STVA_48890 [Allostella vacuolata]|nr:hypothetical protein STVA_48890 [Stella vacuolata]